MEDYKNLPKNFKLDLAKNGSRVFKSSCFIPKGTKLFSLNGVFVNRDQSDNCIQIIDNENSNIGWLEVDDFPSWAIYLKIKDESDYFNLSAMYSNNQVKLK